MKINNYNYLKLSMLLLFFSTNSQLFAQEIDGKIEEEIPVYKITNPMLRQNSYQLSIRPGYYLPVGGTSSYISIAGVKPLTIGFEIVTPQKYSYGVEIGHQYYQQYKPRATYDYDGTIISTSQVRTMTINPFILTFNKHFASVEKSIRPYFQMGLGISRINYIAYWGFSVDQKKRIAPMAAPAIGVKINLDKSYNWVIDSKIKYQIASFQYDFISRVNYLSADVSLAFRWWKD
jgi:hypothetical protein